MSTEVGRASIALIGVLIVLSCAVVPPAEALWPFTRAKSTRPDTVAAEEWKSRFDSWKERSAVSESSAATRLDEVLENPQRYELDTAQLVALAAAAEAARKGTPAGGAAAGTGTDSPITTSQTITSDPQAEPFPQSRVPPARRPKPGWVVRRCRKGRARPYSSRRASHPSRARHWTATTTTCA
jgi:hypothetical protein